MNKEVRKNREFTKNVEEQTGNIMRKSRGINIKTIKKKKKAADVKMSTVSLQGKYQQKSILNSPRQKLFSVK